MRTTALSVIALLAAFASAAPGGLPISDYLYLLHLCENGGPNAYVGVRYQGINNYRTFNFGECYPYKIDENLAEQAVFCKTVTCYNNPNPDCTGGAVPPVPVPVPVGTTLLNAADFVQLIGQGATCQSDGLS
ncbi:hypothetical protein BDQ12DRAFT_728870 [Crucibulum laeve]|uniref:Uncharacterized protein n=1 Tax=Crucibulum laeve TaxID=68775 RepID=A0A5C3LJ21_9AGAR|nr:hypothetical protein BDQ12DRAFT_728870 [Crucibulum laeve]